MFDSALKFILLASVTIPNFINGDPLRMFEGKMLSVYTFILFLSSMLSQPQRNVPKSIYLIAYSLFFVCVFNVFTHRLDSVILSYCSNVFLFVTSVFLIVTYCKKPEECFKFISIGVLINVIVFAIEKIYGNPFYELLGEDPGALLGNWPRLATYFALTLPFVYKSSKILLFNTVVTICLACVECIQITVLIPFYLILLSDLKNNYVRIFLLLCASCAVYLFHDKIITAFSIRFDCWMFHIKNFVGSWHYLLFGNGLGNPLNEVEKFKDPVIWSSHLQFILGAGVFSIAVYDYIISFIIRNFKNNIETVALINLILIACIEYPAEILRYWPTIAFIFGAYFIKQIRNNLYV